MGAAALQEEILSAHRATTATVPREILDVLDKMTLEAQVALAA